MLRARNVTFAGKKLNFAVGLCDVDKDGIILCDDQEFLKELVGLKGFDVFEVNEETGEAIKVVPKIEVAPEPNLESQLDEIAKLAGIDNVEEAPSLADESQAKKPAKQSRKPVKKTN